MTDHHPEDALTGAMRAMHAAPDDTPRRLVFHAELSQAELFLLLETEAEGERLSPRVFDLSEGRAVLAFVSELQLAEFAGQAAYAALPGRVLVSMLAAAPTPPALLISPEAEHAALLAPEALRWLDQTLNAAAPAESHATPERFTAPDLPPAVLALLVPALERRLSGMPGLGRVVLARAHWQAAPGQAEPGQGRARQGHVLALDGLPEAAQAPIARAVVEALSLSGLDAGGLDVIFPPAGPMAAIAAVGLPLSPAPFVMPDEPLVAEGAHPGANPGLDPDRPPRLK